MSLSDLPKIKPPAVYMKVNGKAGFFVEHNPDACTELEISVPLFSKDEVPIYRCSKDEPFRRECLRICAMHIPQGQKFCPIFDQMKNYLEQKTLVDGDDEN